MIRVYGRLGFTLTELMVSLAIIGVLVSLTLPAIQGARESARKSDCSNRLRQIGLAHHEYHDAFHTLPPGTEPYDSKRPLQAWNAKLLPFLEDNETWLRIEYAYSKSPDPFHSPFHSLFSRSRQAFACPNDARVSEAQFVQKVGKYVGLSSYLGVSGTNYEARNGAFFGGSKTRFAEIHDGLSNTIFVGERPPSADMNFCWWYAGFGGNGSGAFDTTLGVNDTAEGIAELEPQCSTAADYFRPGKVRNQCDCRHFWSLHPSGAHFLFGDNSVRFLNYSISQTTLQAYSTIANGETVSSD